MIKKTLYAGEAFPVSRVLIFHPALAPYRLELLNSLAKRYQLKVVFLHDNLLVRKFDQSALRRQLTVEHSYLASGFTLRTRAIRYGIGREIAAFKPDVVITPEYSPITLAVAFHCRMSKSQFRHVVWTDDNSESVARDAALRRFLRRILLPRLDGIVVLSDESAELYRSKYNASIPMGIVPILQSEEIFRSQLSKSWDAAEGLKRTHDLSGKRILLFVGRLSAEKRVDLLINAFIAIAIQVPDSVLVLVGDGQERASLESLVVQSALIGRVLFAGRHEGVNLAAWYRLGGVLALTSELERFGAVVNEALLSGIPVVCSKYAGARILIRDNQNGVVLDPMNSAVLQTALQHWLQKGQPVSSELCQGLRPSLMTMRFVDAVDGFAELLNSMTS